MFLLHTHFTLCYMAILSLLTVSNGQLIDFKDGNVGVNFGGYHASAGLGGLLSGDAAKGGLHAEAGTPYGQSAGAGLGGAIEDDGTSKGGLYAGATAGKGVSTGAALGGTVSKEGSYEQSFAKAEVPHKLDETQAHTAGVNFEKEIRVAPVHPISNGKQVEAVPVQPMYADQQFPPSSSKEVYVHKTYLRRPHHWRKYARLSGINVAAPPPQTVQVVEHTYSKPIPPPIQVHKYVQKPNYTGFMTRLFAAPVAPTVVDKDVVVDSTPAKMHNVQYTATIRNNGDLIKDIFNIPITALNAVSQLVGNIASGTSVSVSKNYESSYHH